MWYIAYLYENFFCFKKMFLPPLDPVVFFETFLPQAPVMFCEPDPFSLMLQPCNPDFLTPANTDFKKNVSFWVFCNSWKFARKRSITKSFDWLKTSMKITSYIFQRMLEKLLLWKFWKIIRNTFLVAFLLKKLSCPIYPLITIAKTDSTVSVSFVCS